MTISAYHFYGHLFFFSTRIPELMCRFIYLHKSFKSFFEIISLIIKKISFIRIQFTFRSFQGHPFLHCTHLKIPLVSIPFLQTLSTAYARAPTDVEAFTMRVDPGGVSRGAIQTALTFPQKPLGNTQQNNKVHATTLKVISCYFFRKCSIKYTILQDIFSNNTGN